MCIVVAEIDYRRVGIVHLVGDHSIPPPCSREYFPGYINCAGFASVPYPNSKLKMQKRAPRRMYDSTQLAYASFLSRTRLDD